MAKRYNVPKYAKNLGKSTAKITGNIMRVNMPILSDTATQMSSVTREFGRFSSEMRQKMKQEHRRNKNLLFRPVTEIIENIKDDLRTGKFYNEERELQESSRGMSDLLGTMTEYNEAAEMQAFDKIIESSSNIPTMNKTYSDAISRNATANAEYLGELSNYQHTQSMMIATKNHMETMKAFGNLEKIGMSLMEFNTKTMTDHIMRTKEYQDTSLKLLETINESIVEISNLNKKSRNTGARNSSSSNALDDLFMPNGAINPKEYMNLIKSNIDKMVPVNMSMLKQYGRTLKASPISSMIELLAQSILPQKTKGKLKNLDNAIGAMFSEYFTAMGKWRRSDNGFKRFLGEILGIDATKGLTPNLSVYRNQELDADLELKKAKAITEVIPSYLNQILKSMTGTDKLFDYNRGMFVNRSSTKKDIEDRIRSQAVMDIGNDTMRKNFDAVRRKLSKKDQEILFEDYTSFLFFLATNSEFDPGASGSTYEKAMANGMRELRGGKQAYNACVAAYKSMSRNELDEFKVKRTQSTINISTLSRRMSEDLVNSGMSALFNNMDGSFNNILNIPNMNASANKSEINWSGLQSFDKIMKEDKNKRIIETEEEKKRRLEIEEEEARRFFNTPTGKKFKSVLSKLKNTGLAGSAKLKNFAKTIIGDNSIVNDMIDKATGVVHDITDGKVINDIKSKAISIKDNYKSNKTTSSNDSDESVFDDSMIGIFKSFLPKAALGGAIGALVSKMFKKRPMIGAIAGGMINILASTSKVQKALWGDKETGDKGFFGDLADNIKSKVMDPIKDIFDQTVGNPFGEFVSKKTDQMKVWLSNKFGFEFGTKKKDKETIISEKLDTIIDEIKDKNDNDREEARSVSDTLEDALNPDGSKRSSKFKDAFSNAISGIEKAGKKGLSAGKGALVSSFLGLGPIPGALIGMLFGGKKKNKKKVDKKEIKDIENQDKEIDEIDTKSGYKRMSVLKASTLSSLLGLGPIPGALVSMIVNRHRKKKFKKEDYKEAENIQKSVEENENEEKKSKGGNFFRKRRNEILGMLGSSILGLGPIPGFIAARIYDNKKYGKKNKDEEGNEGIFSLLKGKVSKGFSGIKNKLGDKIDEIKRLRRAKDEQTLTNKMVRNVIRGEGHKNQEIIESAMRAADTEEELKSVERASSVVDNMVNSGSVVPGEKKSTAEKGGISKLFDKLFGNKDNGSGGSGFLGGLLGGSFGSIIKNVVGVAGPIVLGFGINKIVGMLKNSGFGGLNTKNSVGDSNFANSTDIAGDVGKSLYSYGASKAASKLIGPGVAGSTFLIGQGINSTSKNFATAGAYYDRGASELGQEEIGKGTLRIARAAGLSAHVAKNAYMTYRRSALSNPGGVASKIHTIAKNSDNLIGNVFNKIGKFFGKSIKNKNKIVNFVKTKATDAMKKAGTKFGAKWLGKLAAKLAGWPLLVASLVGAFISGFNNASRDYMIDPSDSTFKRLRLVNGILYMLDELLMGTLDLLGLKDVLRNALGKLVLSDEEEAQLYASQNKLAENYEKFLQENDLNREGFTLDMYNKYTNKSIWGNVKSWFTGDELDKYRTGGTKNADLKGKYGGYVTGGGGNIVSIDNSEHNNIIMDSASGSGARGSETPNTVLSRVRSMIKNSKNANIIKNGDWTALGSSNPYLYDPYFSRENIIKSVGSGARGFTDIKNKLINKLGIGMSSGNTKASMTKNNEINVGQKDIQKNNPGMWERIKNGASSIFGGIKSFGSKVWSGLKGIWNWLTGGSGARGEDPDYYSQFDPRWANMSFGRYDGKRDTVSAGGCGPAVAAMALQKITGKHITPATMAKLALSTGMKYDDGGTDPSFFNEAGSKYGVSFDNSYGLTGNTISALKSGYPVVFMGRDVTGTSPFGPGSHYILGNGMDRYGNVNVLDPQNPLNNRMYNISDLAANSMNIMTPRGRGIDKRNFGRAGFYTDSINESLEYYNNKSNTCSEMQKKIANAACGRIGETKFRNTDTHAGTTVGGMCYAFVENVYVEAGMPRVSAADAIAGFNIDPSHRNDTNPPIGACVYWTNCGNGHGHVGIYVGGNYVIHAKNTDGGKVTKDKFSKGALGNNWLPSSKYLGWNFLGSDSYVGGYGTTGYVPPVGGAASVYSGTESRTSDSTPGEGPTANNRLTKLLMALSGASKYSSVAQMVGLVGGATAKAASNSGNAEGTYSHGEHVLPTDKSYGTTPTYMGWHKITAKDSSQYKLRAAAGESYDSSGLARINGRYVVATTNTFGNVGDYITVRYSDGTTLDCIIGDIKNTNDSGANKYGHNQGGSVVEFVTNRSWYNSAGTKGIGKNTDLPNYGKGIVSINNTGNYWGRGVGLTSPSIPGRLKSRTNALSMSVESDRNLIKSALAAKKVSSIVSSSKINSAIGASENTSVQSQNMDVSTIVAALNRIVDILTSIDGSNKDIANKPNSGTTVVPVNNGRSYGSVQQNNKQHILNSIISGI